MKCILTIVYEQLKYKYEDMFTFLNKFELVFKEREYTIYFVE